MTARLLHPAASLLDASTGDVLTGAALQSRVDAVSAAARRLPPGVVMLRTPLSVHSVLAYLGLFASGRPVVLIDPSLDDDALADLIGRYRPVALAGLDRDRSPATEDYALEDDDALGPVLRRRAGGVVEPHPRLGLLLPTSGSTGSPKLVRLSREAVVANATSIAAALALDEREIAVTSLSLFYSYGLSVLNSHLVVGARVVVTDRSLVEREFWQALQAHGVTSLAAVPYQYEMLKRLRFAPDRYPALRTLTQAGGRLAPDLVDDFAQRMSAVGGRLHVMYGQTEATARMSVLPADRLAAKPGSVGLAIPGGRFAIRSERGLTTDPGEQGEVVYSGPNVMMGYADTAADLARGDELDGTLDTGDLGHLDEEGFLYITGRSRRIAKVFGVRVNLDDVEGMLRTSALAPGPVAAVSGDDRLLVFVEGADGSACETVARALADRMHLHPTGFLVRGVPQMPLLSNGKVDYASLVGTR